MTETNTEQAVASVTATEAAERLGVHFNTLRRWIDMGRIPAAKEGREWRVPIAAIEAEQDARAAEFREASDAATASDYLSAWVQVRSADTMAALAIAATDYVMAWRAMVEVPEAAAHVVRKSRIEQLDAEIGRLTDATDRFRALRSVAGAAAELLAEAISRGQDADAMTDADIEALRGRVDAMDSKPDSER